MKSYLFSTFITILILSCSQNRELSDVKWVPFDETQLKHENEINCSYNNDITYKYSQVDTKPIMIKQYPPVYPDNARKTQTEGVVVVAVIIDELGNVIKTDICKSVPGLNDTSIDAAKKSKFKPGYIKDKAVKVCMVIPFNFLLR